MGLWRKTEAKLAHAEDGTAQVPELSLVKKAADSFDTRCDYARGTLNQSHHHPAKTYILCMINVFLGTLYISQ